jgi:quinol monooxygenase YgiN
MIVVVGQFRLPVERLAEAQDAMARVMVATRAEAGSVQYNYAADLLDEGLIRVSEVWESRAQLPAHLATPHMQKWVEERAGLGLSERAITVYEADGGTPL